MEKVPSPQLEIGATRKRSGAPAQPLTGEVTPPEVLALQISLDPAERYYFDKLKAELMQLFENQSYEEILREQNADKLRQVALKLAQIQRFLIKREKREITDVDDEEYVVETGVPGVQRISLYENRGKFWLSSEAKTNWDDVWSTYDYLGRPNCGFTEGRVVGFVPVGEQLFFLFQESLKADYNQLVDANGKKLFEGRAVQAFKYNGKIYFSTLVPGPRIKLDQRLKASGVSEQILLTAYFDETGQRVFSEYESIDRVKIPESAIEYSEEFLIGGKRNRWRRFFDTISLRANVFLRETHLIYNGVDVSGAKVDIRFPQALNGQAYYVEAARGGAYLCCGKKRLSKWYPRIYQPLKTADNVYYIAEMHTGFKVILDASGKEVLPCAQGTSQFYEEINMVEFEGKLFVFYIKLQKAYVKNLTGGEDIEIPVTREEDITGMRVYRVGSEIYFANESRIFDSRGKELTILLQTTRPQQLPEIFDVAGQMYYSAPAREQEKDSDKWVYNHLHQPVLALAKKELGPYVMGRRLIALSPAGDKFRVVNETDVAYNSEEYDEVFVIKQIDKERFFVIGKRGSQVVKEVFNI